MTHPDTAKMLNEQIERELRKLNSIITDEADKPAIIQRIADLKAMLDDDSPVVTNHQPAQPTTRELIAEAIKALRNR